jgi:GDP-L-fucose synthase
MERHNGSQIVNIGTGADVTIKELAETIRRIVGYKGDIAWDTTRPDGMPRKLLDVSLLHGSGWKHGVEVEEGIRKTYEAFLE